MIQSYRNRETERLSHGGFVREFQGFSFQARKRLWQLDSAVTIEDLRRVRGNHLEMLSGDKSGQHSIRINRRWRICFRWEEDGAHDVEIVDYH